MSTAGHKGQSPLVSVIMPVHDGAAACHVREAVESVLAQSHSTLELIVVLDGPVGEPVQEYLSSAHGRDARLRVLSLGASQGPAAARNHGIAQAQGGFVALLDSDDVAAPERIGRQLAFLAEAKADVVGSWYSRIGAAGISHGVHRLPLSTRAIRWWSAFFNPMANSTILARREVMANELFPEDYRYGEDYALWVALLRTGRVLRNQPAPLVSFRIGSGFAARRRGWHAFQTDWATKRRALALYPIPARPFVAALSLAVSLGRLLPARLLGWLYRFRNRW